MAEPENTRADEALPSTGGSYVRLPDKTLQRLDDAAPEPGAEPAEAPAKSKKEPK